MLSNQMLYAAASIVLIAAWVIKRRYSQEADAVVALESEHKTSENPVVVDSSANDQQIVDDALSVKAHLSMPNRAPSIHASERDASLEIDDDSAVDPSIPLVTLDRPDSFVGSERSDHADSGVSHLTEVEEVDRELEKALTDFGSKLKERSAGKKWLTSGLSKPYSVGQPGAQAENMNDRIDAGIASIKDSLSHLDKASEDYASRIEGIYERVAMYQNQSKPSRTPRGYVLEDLTSFAKHGLSLVYVQAKMDLLMQRLQEKKGSAFPLSAWGDIKNKLFVINRRIDEASHSQQEETKTQAGLAFNAFKQGMDEVNQQIDQYLKENLFSSSAETVREKIDVKVNAIEEVCLASLPIVISKPVLISGDPLVNRRPLTSLDRFLSIDTGMKDIPIHIGSGKLRPKILGELLSVTDSPLQQLKSLISQHYDGLGFSDSFRAMCDILAKEEITLKPSDGQSINIVDACRSAVQGRASVLYQQFNHDAVQGVSDSMREFVPQDEDVKEAIAIFTGDINALCKDLDVLKSPEATLEAKVAALHAMHGIFHRWKLDAARAYANQPLLDQPNDSAGDNKVQKI